MAALRLTRTELIAAESNCGGVLAPGKYKSSRTASESPCAKQRRVHLHHSGVVRAPLAECSHSVLNKRQ